MLINKTEWLWTWNIYILHVIYICFILYIYICNISFKAIESHKIIILEEYFQKPILQDTSIKGLYGYMHLENAGI